MAVELDKYSLIKAPKQAFDLHRLVRDERDWLIGIFPGAAERYRDLPHAVRNVARLATSEGFHYLIRRDRAAVGVATLFMRQRVEHPVEGVIEANDVDYWLKGGSHEILHKEVANALLEASGREELRLTGFPRLTVESQDSTAGEAGIEDAVNALMTTTPLGQGYNRGLHTLLSPKGVPAVLTTPEGSDPHDLTKAGDILQLYTASYMVTRLKSGELDFSRI